MSGDFSGIILPTIRDAWSIDTEEFAVHASQQK
jgi:hypothetical protein